MENRILGRKLLDRNGILYPLLVLAALTVILFSIVGVATMTGLLPMAASSVQEVETAPASPRHSPVTPGARLPCGNCGVIESVHAMDVKPSGSGLGAIAGGIAGAVIGNQIGRGSGNTVATIAGAAGGAYAGNEIEKNVNKSVRYRVRVRMQDGTLRTAYQSSVPAFAVGDRVRVVNGQVVADG